MSWDLSVTYLFEISEITFDYGPALPPDVPGYERSPGRSVMHYVSMVYFIMILCLFITLELFKICVHKSTAYNEGKTGVEGS